MKSRIVVCVVLLGTFWIATGCGDGEVHMTEQEMSKNISDRHKADAVRSLPPGVPDGVKEKIEQTPVGGR